MYSVPHLISTKGNNKGSCRKYAEYLLKDNSFFFNHSSDSIDLEEGVLLIDENSKRGLGKEDAKWFAPVYALSEEESQFIAYQLFGREVENFSDLTEQEQKKYNEYVVMLGKGFQDEMAKNFNKEDLGIRTGKDLFYIGVVENKRNYTHQDEEVLMGLKKRGEEKGGFNTHIHIIQSRLANNGKYSKISPMSNERKVRTNNLGRKVGFDRNNFANRVEQYFDRITKYVRNINETFEYKKAKKKGKDLTDFKVKELKIEEAPTEKKEEEPLTEERQIIIVTHNSNIVIGGDSELVIVSNQQGVNSPNKQSKKFDYVFGSIESSKEKDNNITEILYSQGIRQHICEIL